MTERLGFIVTADMARNRFSRLEELDFSMRVLPELDSKEGLTLALEEARRQLEDSRTSRSELAFAIDSAIKSAISGMTIPPVLEPAPVVSDDTARAVLPGGDWQIGKLIKGHYDSATAMRRLDDYFDEVVDRIQVGPYHIDEAHLLLLGDLLENETIFPSQPYLIDSSLYRQVFLVAEAITNGIRKLLSVVSRVYVEGVGGNHGYNQKTSHPETNFDCMAMNVSRLLLADEPRLTFLEPFTPSEEHWYMLHDVGPLRFFGIHGNQIRSQPYSKAMRDKLMNYHGTVGGFDFALTAHYHQSLMADIGPFIHVATGSTESNNTFAKQWLATGAQMGSQWMLVVDDDGLREAHHIRLP